MEQNTNRMWWTIGAVLLGGILISGFLFIISNNFTPKISEKMNALIKTTEPSNIEVGGINLLTGTDEETVYVNDTDGWKEFLRTPYDLAKVFDKHGLVTYTLSFDLKTAKDGWVDVYQQNGAGSRYDGPNYQIAATTEWKRYHVTFTPKEAKMELSESFLAFYGGYGTGVVPYARKFKLEKGTVPTDYSRANEDIQDEIDSKADDAMTTEHKR